MSTFTKGSDHRLQAQSQSEIREPLLDGEANAHVILLVLDTDNLGANRRAVVQAVRHHLEQVQVSRIQAEVVGRSLTAGEEFAQAVHAELPWARVRCHPAPSAKDGADAIICYVLGRFVGDVRSSDSNAFAYVLTRDKAIRNAALHCLVDGVGVALPHASEAELREGVVSIEIGDARPKLQTPLARPEAPPLPEWCRPDTAVNGTHLFCNQPPPGGPISGSFGLPFPRRVSKVTIGCGATCALDLSPWDTGRGGLYNPHLTFTYASHPDSAWRVRAMKGMRRGKRRVVVAGTHIHSACGDVPIAAGTGIEVGDFPFEFRPNRVSDIADLEDPMVLVGALERKLKSAADQLPQSAIPLSVREELAGFNGIDWERAYFRHFEAVFAAAWSGGDRSSWPQNCFASLSSLHRIFGRLNRIRNVVMHPVRGDVGHEDRQKLAEAFCLLWPSA